MVSTPSPSLILKWPLPAAILMQSIPPGCLQRRNPDGLSPLLLAPQAMENGRKQPPHVRICYARFSKNRLYIIGFRFYIIVFLFIYKIFKKVPNFAPFFWFPPFLYIIRPRLYTKRVLAFVLFIYNPNFFIYRSGGAHEVPP